MSEFDPYLTVLGLDRNATKVEIKQAYRSLAKKWHPDRYANQPQLLEEAEIKIQQINQAYEKLKNYTPGATNDYSSSSSSSNGSSSKPQTQTNVTSGSQSAAKIHYTRGVEFAQKEEFDPAIAEFTQAIRINPNFINAYQYRGYILSKLGYDLRAEADFHRVESLKLAQQLGTSARSSNSRPRSSSRYRSQTAQKYERHYKQSRPDLIDFLEKYWFLILMALLGLLLAAV